MLQGYSNVTNQWLLIRSSYIDLFIYLGLSAEAQTHVGL